MTADGPIVSADIHTLTAWKEVNLGRRFVRRRWYRR